MQLLTTYQLSNILTSSKETCLQIFDIWFVHLKIPGATFPTGQCGRALNFFWGCVRWTGSQAKPSPFVTMSATRQKPGIWEIRAQTNDTRFRLFLRCRLASS